MEGADKKTSNQKEKGHRKGNYEFKADLPMCDSTCDVFLEPQETPFLSSITENKENTTVDQPADDSQSIIRDIQIENERLRKEIHQVTTLKKDILNWKWRNWHIESAYKRQEYSR